MKTLVKIAAISAIIVPMVAFAQANDLLANTNRVLLSVIPVLMVLATVVFLWGVVMYVIAGGDEEKLGRAKGYIVAGIIGLFVMLAVWGIVNALAGTLGLTQTAIPVGPR